MLLWESQAIHHVPDKEAPNLENPIFPSSKMGFYNA